MTRRQLLLAALGTIGTATVFTSPVAGAGQNTREPRYPSPGPGHFIKENRENGRFFVLEDKSLWETPPGDRYRTAEWQELEGISVRFADGDPPYAYELTNLDRDEGVAARWIPPAQ